MLTVKAVRDTFFKSRPEQASTLLTNERFFVPTNTEFQIGWYKDMGAHVLFEMREKAKGRYNWLAFKKHSQILQDGKVLENFGAQPAFTKVPPFWDQLNNYRDPHRTCNCSATAMAIKMVGAEISSDDELVELVFRHGDTTDHANVDWVVYHYYKVRSEFRYDMSLANLDKELAAGKPVVLGILHKGGLSNPYGGHMICCFAKEGPNYVCHDPYGSLLNAYTGPVSDGNAVRYPDWQLMRRWCPGGNDGWGRIFPNL
jgi:hypothetical protein